MKRLLIVADNSLVVQAIRLALRQTAGFQVVGCLNGRTPVRARLAELRPDVVLIDDMGDAQSTLDRVAEAQEEAPEAKLIVLSLEMRDERLDELFAAGAETVLSKSIHPVALGTLLRETARENIAQRRRSRSQELPFPLTPRETEILTMAANGDTNGHIARDLWITEQTVKFHLSNAYRKLGVRNRTEATRYVLLHPPPAPAGAARAKAGVS
jgi:DNA-binding NarL/FixJ family response regulator